MARSLSWKKLFNTLTTSSNDRSEIIHAERKREQQTFETIEEEDDYDENDAPPRRPSRSYSYGSEISLVTEERENHRRKDKKRQQKSQRLCLDLERSLSARALKVRHV